MTVRYDPSVSFVSMLFRWHGTVLPLVARKPLFWCLSLLQIILVTAHTVLKHYELGLCTEWGLHDLCEHGLPPLEWSAVKTPAQLLVFFIVFYGNSCYTRFYELFTDCVAIGGATLEWTTLVKAHVPVERHDQRWNAVRYILAAQHTFYAGVEGPITDAAWAQMRSRALLADAEVAAVQAHGGNRTVLLLNWAIEEAKLAAAAGGGGGGEAAAAAQLRLQQYVDVAFTMRRSASAIVNMLAQPVPFPYFHILTLMIVVILTIISYGLTFLGNPVLIFVVFFLAAASLIGLKEVAVALSDPFGEDAVDFEVDKFISASYRDCLALLADSDVPRARRQRSAAALPDGLKNPLGEEGGLRAAVELAAAGASRPPAHSVSIDDRHSSGAFRASSGHKGRKKQASRSHHMGMLDGSAKQEGNPSAGAEGRGSAALLGTARVEMTSEL